ncbi:MAG: T9SS type A sorting domain-containing protein [Candidatus Kapaibacterium sp.]
MAFRLLAIIITIGFLSGFNMKAQESHDDGLPFFMKPDFVEDYRSWLEFGNTKRKIAGDPPKEFYKIKPGPETILNSTGGFEIKNISNLQSAQNEVWIAVNPTNPLNIIAGSNDYFHGSLAQDYKMPAFVTTDGGQNWQTTTLPANFDLIIKTENGSSNLVFDPGVTFDSQGRAYYCYGYTVTGDDSKTDGENGLFVGRSLDGGLSWEEMPSIVAIGDGTGFSGGEFHDKYLIAADANPDSPYRDNVYVAWTRFKAGSPSSIVVSTSTDGGMGWSTPFPLSSGFSSKQSPMPAVGPDGTVYVTWRSESSDKTSALLSRSTDGGQTWTSSLLAQEVVSVGVRNSQSGRQTLPDKLNPIRVSSYPAIDVDRSNGERNGWVYIVQCGKDEQGNTGCYLARSSNNGDDWERNLRVDNGDGQGDLFFPAISVDPVNGNVYVAYYSSQDHDNNDMIDVYVAISTDGGENFNHIKVNETSFGARGLGDNGNYYWGDYISMASYNNNIYPCWWQPTPGGDVFWSHDVYTALLSTNPQIVQDLQADNNFRDPLSVKLTWQDPAKDLLGNDLDGFEVIIHRNQTEIGRVDKGVQSYDDMTAENGETYVYTLYVETPDGRRSGPTELRVTAGGALQPNAPFILSGVSSEDGVIINWENPAEHIDGTVFHDFKAIEIYDMDDNLLKSVSMDATLAGLESSELIELDTESFYEIKLQAVAERNGTETRSNFSNYKIVYSGAPATDLSEDFDNESNLVPMYFRDSNPWIVIQDAKTTSPPNCITDSPDGNYESNDNNMFIMQPVVLNDQHNSISIDHMAIIHSNDDGRILLSNDHMKSWEHLKWVDNNSSDKFSTNYESSQFDNLLINIQEFQGDTVYLAFELNSDGAFEYDGWYIDNVELSSIVSVDEEGLMAGAHVDVYPNPVTDDAAKLNIKVSANGYGRINIYDALGNKVKELNSTYLTSGMNEVDLDLSELTSGAYYCRISMDESSISVPVIIRR